MNQNIINEELVKIFDVALCSVNIESYEVQDKEFGLKDRLEKSVCVASEGNVTYKNNSDSIINVFNYEKFIESLPDSKNYGIRHCDFIVYSDNVFFICNELSTGVNTKSKWPKAWKQMQQTIQVLYKSEKIKKDLENVNSKFCVFSFCLKDINSPLGIADSFGRPLSLIKSVQEREWYPINRLDFHVYESNYVVYNADKSLSFMQK